MQAGSREGHPGCWCGDGSRKIGAVGVRVERGVSYHGIALNVSVRLADFELIDACGMPGVESTSIDRETGASLRALDRVGRARPHPRSPARWRGRLARRWRVPPPDSDPVAARRELEALLASPRESGPRVGRSSLMGAGLFELRRDAITGWWVATVVDRQFQRGRFSLAAGQVDDGGQCQNCIQPPGDGVRVRTLKDYAFNVVGTVDEAREMERSLAQVAMAQARASGSWRTVVAPPGEHRPLQLIGSEVLGEMLVGGQAGHRGRPQGAARPSTCRSSRTGAPRPGPGPTTSAWTSTTCRRSRTASPRRSAGPRAT